MRGVTSYPLSLSLCRSSELFSVLGGVARIYGRRNIVIRKNKAKEAKKSQKSMHATKNSLANHKTGKAGGRRARSHAVKRRRARRKEGKRKTRRGKL